MIQRIKEHLTGENSISAHISVCDECLQGTTVDSFDVVDHGRSDFECLIKEALIIKEQLPKLNNHLYTGYSYNLKVF